jgi:5-methylcytosine-specific restriction endonuclease McrA
VSQAIDEVRAKLLKSAFQMPSVQTMVSRKSSITNAFVCAIVPVDEPSVEDIEEALRILAMSPNDLRCAYCGDRSTEWDHLRPLVKNRLPTGFMSEIGNLVPACGKCNQSKGNKEWESWMRGEKAKWSPRKRGIADLEQRIERLRSYEKWKPSKKLEFEAIVGKEAWDNYWKRLQAMDQTLHECQAAAVELGKKIAEARHAQMRVSQPPVA